VHTNQFEKAGSSWLQAMLNYMMLAPVLLFAPFTGAWVDRMNLKRVLLTTDSMRAVIVVMIPIAYMTTHLMAPVFSLVFLLFTCNVLFLPAKSAITPQIVHGQQLLTANAFLAGAGIVATGLGVGGGGWIVDHWGWANSIYTNGLTYLVSVAALAFILYTPHKPTVERAPMSFAAYLREVGEGWGLVRRSVPVGVALIALGAVWVAGGFFSVAGVQRIVQEASIPGMLRIGVLAMILSVGAGLGTWWVNRIGRHMAQHILLGGGLVIGSAGVIALAVSSRFAVFSAAALIVGLCIAPVFVLSETLLQLGTPPGQRGRVFSSRDFIMRLLLLVSSTLAAWLTDAYGTRTSLLVAAGLFVGAGVLTIWYGGRAGPWENLQSDEVAAHPVTGTL
jgi:MFS family permease